MSDEVIADILRADTENGVPVANIGEQTTGLGFGADTVVWGNGDGFLSVPNQPSSAGAAQAVVVQDGHVKRATVTRDQRWVTKAGTLEPGDRAIVSDSEAWIRLTRTSDKIEIVAGTAKITIEGGGNSVVIDSGASHIQMSPTSIIISNTGSPTVAMALASGSIAMAAPTGVTITSPTVNVVGVLQVGGTPLIVP